MEYLNKILVGDNIDLLKQLPDNSVNCCITSPPYYGLRDYGTGTWSGGDPNCRHENGTFGKNVKVGTHKKFKDDGARQVGNSHMMKQTCTKCGAVRVDKQIGLEDTPTQYIERLVEVFREIKRVLTEDGTCWINIGDTYNSSATGSVNNKQVTNQGSLSQTHTKHIVDECKPKDLIGIPWMLAFALRADGWYLRQDIIWHKPNPMPESIKDRCTKSHEYIFLLSKSQRYYFDYEAIQEEVSSVVSNTIRFGGNKYGDSSDPKYSIYSGNAYEFTGKRNKRDVWSITPSSFKGAHFATYPEELVRTCLVAGCPKDGIVIDPFMGSGTTGVVAKRENRNYVGCELNKSYADMATDRISKVNKRLF